MLFFVMVACKDMFLLIAGRHILHKHPHRHGHPDVSHRLIGPNCQVEEGGDRMR